jgi:hypothetical protein
MELVVDGPTVMERRCAARDKNPFLMTAEKRNAWFASCRF